MQSYFAPYEAKTLYKLLLINMAVPFGSKVCCYTLAIRAVRYGRQFFMPKMLCVGCVSKHMQNYGSSKKPL